MSTLAFLMQSDNTTGNAAAGIFGGVIGIIWLAVIVLMIAALWKIFVKAGEPGWAAIVPIYNLMIILKIVGRPLWWLVLFIIPIANLVVAFIVAFDLAKAFGKGAGFALGMIFLSPIFYPILGFGSAKYQGAVAAA